MAHITKIATVETTTAIWEYDPSLPNNHVFYKWFIGCHCCNLNTCHKSMFKFYIPIPIASNHFLVTPVSFGLRALFWSPAHSHLPFLTLYGPSLFWSSRLWLSFGLSMTWLVPGPLISMPSASQGRLQESAGMQFSLSFVLYGWWATVLFNNVSGTAAMTMSVLAENSRRGAHNDHLLK